MADCGASGTALDQATRALMGGTGSASALNAQKQVENLLGHTALTGANGQAVIPHSQPQFVSPTLGHGHDTLLASVPQRSAYPHANHHHHFQRPHQQHMPAEFGVAVAQQMNYSIPNNHFLHMQQQQQHAMAMAHHQQQQQQQQIQHLLKRQMEANQEKEQHETAQEVAHESSIDDVAVSVEDLQEALGEQDFDEGVPRGATIEELAAAWAEAQDMAFEADVAAAGVDPLTDDAGILGPTGEFQTQPYQFVNNQVQQNMEKLSNTNFLEEGIQQFKQGNLAEAIKNFEMELQLNDPDNSAAWLMLGKCHAENDMDRDAILCLETAVEKDPYSTEALLALGVSYVNELNHAKALSVLKSWVTTNPKYAGMDLSSGEDVYGDVHEGAKQHDADFAELQDLLLKVLEFDPDPSIWEALGVAANVSRDYVTAVEAFQKAVEARPDDYQLWNKLGATLANSNQSAKALNAYHKAIALKPKYCRAWLNMAISHSNLQDFDEAARCYLQTLSLNPSAVHCWSYLRVALTCAERWDLIPFAASQDLDAFAKHFDFVRYN